MDRTVAVRLKADISQFQRSMLTAGTSAKAFAKNLDEADSRMSNLVQTGLALAPALIPIGAAAVPAIAGLTLQLGLAAGAAGVAVMAFNGVGDGLKALNAYQLNPTAENFKKLNDALDKLGPAGQEFVLALDKMTPKFDQLRNLAEKGLLPGVSDGLNELMALMPRARDMVATFSTTLGDLVKQGAGNLAGSSEWVKFFDYINTTARPVLTEMGQTFGNVVSGLANMVMAFDPLSRSFSTGLRDMSQSFKDWTDNLQGSKGFQDFIDYVQSNGPKALDALGALAKAIISIVEAAAPVGQVLLPVITDLATTLASIADSPVGPVLVGVAAGVGVLGRSMALLRTVGLSGGAGGDGLLAKIFNPAKIKAGAAALGTVTGATERATLSVSALQKVEAERAATARAGIAQFGKSAALVGGLALATSGLADKTGAANTVTMALMGSIAGPWGAAIGGGVGLVMDFAKANNDLSDSMKLVDAAAANPIGLSQQASSIKNAQAAVDKYQQQASDAFDPSKIGSLKGTLIGISDLWTHAGEKAQASLADQRGAMMAMRQNLAELYGALNHGNTGTLLSAPLADVEAFAAKVAPALQAAGLSFDDLASKPDAVAAAVRRYDASMDSANGKSRAVGKALADLGSQMESNVSQADQLKSAMDSLFGIQLSESAATDAWVQGLRAMRKALKESKGVIDGNSDAALKSRAAIRSQVQVLEDKINAEAAAGASGKKLTGILKTGRQALINQADAAGVSRSAMRRYLNTLGLTPKNITTIIRAVDKATPVVAGVKAAIAALHSKTVYLDLVRREQNFATFAPPPGSTPTRPHAIGGYISGPGTATSDSIPAMLSNGEYVVKSAAVAKYGLNMFDRLNAMHYASGGSVRSTKSIADGLTASQIHYTPAERKEQAENARRTHAVNGELHQMEGALSRTRKKLDDLRQAQADYESTIRDSFTHDIFGNGLAGLRTQLNADANDASNMLHALMVASKHGLSGGLEKALAASGDLNTAQQVAALSPGEIRALEKQFDRRTSVTTTLAHYGGIQVYGAAIAKVDKTNNQLARTINHLQVELKHLREVGKHVENGARAGTAAGIAARDKAAAARRKAKR